MHEREGRLFCCTKQLAPVSVRFLNRALTDAAAASYVGQSETPEKRRHNWRNLARLRAAWGRRALFLFGIAPEKGQNVFAGFGSGESDEGSEDLPHLRGHQRHPEAVRGPERLPGDVRLSVSDANAVKELLPQLYFKRLLPLKGSAETDFVRCARNAAQTRERGWRLLCVL